jgi:hypothetical protein
MKTDLTYPIGGWNELAWSPHNGSIIAFDKITFKCRFYEWFIDFPQD